MTVLRGLLMIVPVMVIAAGRLGLVMDMVTVKIRHMAVTLAAIVMMAMTVLIMTVPVLHTVML